MNKLFVFVLLSLAVISAFEFDLDGAEVSTGEGVTTGDITTGDVTSGTSSSTTNSTTGITTGTTGDQGTCEEQQSCQECSNHGSDCVWCEEKKLCIAGEWYGPQEKSECSSWRYKQCKVDGKFVIYGSAGGVVLIILILVIIICKCMCCQKKKYYPRDFKEFKSFKASEEEKESLITTSHPKTDQRRQELAKKYGDSLRKV